MRNQPTTDTETPAAAALDAVDPAGAPAPEPETPGEQSPETPDAAPTEEATDVTEPGQTCGQLADLRAKNQSIPGRQFSFKLDGVVAPREAPTSLLEAAAVIELVEVTDYQYPETPIEP